MKYLHTMLRVGDLDRSIRFYCEVLGFRLLSKEDFPNGKFSLAFLQASGDSEAQLELTYNWGVSSYEIGTAYGHLAYEVKSIEEVRERLKAHELDLSWGPKTSPSGRSTIAFFQDPDGYRVELIERTGKEL